MMFSSDFVQEMCARLGVVTGKGLADSSASSRRALDGDSMLALLVANGGGIVSEFVGIAAASELFGSADTSPCPSPLSASGGSSSKARTRESERSSF